MKPHLTGRILTAGVALSLLLLTLAPSPILAAGEWIDLDPESGNDGDNVRVSGEDFESSYQKKSGDWVRVYVRVYFSCDEADVGDFIGEDVEDYEIVDKSEKVDKHGEWKVSFTVPRWLTDGEDEQDIEGGTYYVYVTYKGDDQIVAAEEFDIRGVNTYWSSRWAWSSCGPSWNWYYSPWYSRYYWYYDDWDCCPPCPCPCPDDCDDDCVYPPFPWIVPCPDEWDDDYYCVPFPWRYPCSDDCDDDCFPFPFPPMPDYECHPDCN